MQSNKDVAAGSELALLFLRPEKQFGGESKAIIGGGDEGSLEYSAFGECSIRVATQRPSNDDDDDGRTSFGIFSLARCYQLP